jgi:molybdopterin/thiamine biosynthesis adenylyltransferase
MAGEYPSLRITAYPEWVVEDSVRRAVTENCVVISCVDNHPARRTISQALSKLENGIMISAGNELIDGDVCVQIRVDGKNLTQTVLERHPEILTATEGDRTGKGCEDEINQGVTQLLVTNLMAATMAFSLFHRLWVTEDKENLPQEAFFNLEVGKAVVYDVDKPKGAEDQTAVSALHIPTIPDVSSATDSSADKLPQHAHVVRKARKRAKKKESSQ